MRIRSMTLGLLVAVAALVPGLAARAEDTAPPESVNTIWLEAEHLDGIEGYCWPMGKPSMRKTDGHWGLSGPGWAAEWNQGGESGFLSIATGADDDRAVVTKTLDVPAAGDYTLWVRYGDWREAAEPFDVRIEQPQRESWKATFGEHPRFDEDNVMKLYWGWAFAWDSRPVSLAKGEATLTLAATSKADQPRQVDAIVLTTDKAYRPVIKDRPVNPAWELLESWRDGVPKLEPLAKRTGAFDLPDAWKLRTFNDRGFVYLWNAGAAGNVPDWLSDDPKRVPVPYNLRDADVLDAFKAKYAGRTDVPIFGDPRVVPTFHGAGGAIFATDGMDGDVQPLGQRMAKWLDADPDRLWATMMNYHPGQPIGPAGQAMFAKYRDRYVGSIAGESLGYFYVDAGAMRQATGDATTRRGLVDAFTPISLDTHAQKYRKIYGKDLDANPFVDVISCLSVGNMAFGPLLSKWGVRTLGYESAVATSSILNMRWAFMRGLARQGHHLTATYRSCNFGDSATMYSNASSYTSPQNLLDNYYSVYSGAGMTWYKFDIWYQYMAGASMFYHEQGFDEYWRPGGTTAAGVHDLELSPKGKLVDRFLRATADPTFDRGTPFTPVAFLLDYAHGWEPAPYWPNSFKNWHQQPDRFRFGRHERMLENTFGLAFHPIGPESEKPITALNEVYLPGVFGDIFDIVFAYPDVDRWADLGNYPVVIPTGEIELTADEGKRLAQYVDGGGTLVVAADHLSGDGAAALDLPLGKAQFEGDGYRWLEREAAYPSGRYRYHQLDATGGRVLATTRDGDPICVSYDRGKGRLIVFAVPHAMTIGGQAMPVMAHLLGHVTRGVMPIEVDGDVQWLVSRTRDGWNVTLLNPAGQLKPQQGIFPTDFRENRKVTIRCRVPVSAAYDRLLPTDDIRVNRDGTIELTVPAGGVRIIALAFHLE